MDMADARAVSRPTHAIPPRLIASWPHAIRLVTILAMIGAAGIGVHLLILRSGSGPRAPLPLTLYLSAIASEWLLFRGVGAGLVRAGTPRAEVFGDGVWKSAGLAADHAIALALAGCWLLMIAMTGGVDLARPGGITGRGWVVASLWVALSVSAGICEEFAFRGYLQRQFEAGWRSPALAIVLQGLLFGWLHAYEGVAAAAAIALYGVALGIVARARGNLRAVIIAHVVTDLALGALLR